MHGPLTVCGDIFIHLVAPPLILSYKLSNYTYPIDECLGEFYLELLCVSLFTHLSKEIRGTFPLSILDGVSLYSNIRISYHLSSNYDLRLTSFSVKNWVKILIVTIVCISFGYFVTQHPCV